MSITNVLFISILTFLIVGCGHGYEGTYSPTTNNKFANKMMGKMNIQSPNIEIGKDYIESNGNRETFDDVFVREKGDNQYLVFKKGRKEEAMKILDDGSLEQGNSFMKVKLIKQ